MPRTDFELSLISSTKLKKAIAVEFPTPRYPIIVSVGSQQEATLPSLLARVTRVLGTDRRVDPEDFRRFSLNTQVGQMGRDFVLYEILKRVELD